MRQRMLFRMLLGAQFLIFIFLFGSGLYLFWLSRSSAVLGDPDAAETVHALRLSAEICVGVCVLWGASFLGLLRRQPWGWWLGLVTNFFVFVITVYGLFEERNSDGEDYLVPAIFLVITIIQVLTRPTTWKKMELAEPVAPESQHSAGSGI